MSDDSGGGDVEALARKTLDAYGSDQEFIDICIAGARVALAWDKFRDALKAYTAKHSKQEQSEKARGDKP